MAKDCVVQQKGESLSRKQVSPKTNTAALSEAHGMTYIGIDPGLSGAIAIMGSGLCSAMDVPLFNDGTKRYIDIIGFRNLLLEAAEKTGKPNCLVCLEKAQPMPRDGSMGSFRYGEVYGILKGVIVSLEIPLLEVAPITWKTKMVGKGKGKDASRMAALQLFPQLAERLKLKKDHGRAEAVLLAEYGRRVFSGKHIF